MTHSTACPCGVCKSKQTPLHWLNFNAEEQFLKARGSKFADEELRAMRAMMRDTKDTLDAVVVRVLDRLRPLGAKNIQREHLEAVLRELRISKRELAEGLRLASLPYTQLIAAAGIEFGASLLPEGAIKYDLLFGKASEFVAAATESTAQRMAQSVSASLADRIVNIIRTGVEDNATGTDLIGLLEEQGFNEGRAQAIARTETSHAYGAGQQAAWKASGVVKGKMWLVSPFACAFCEAAGRKYGSTPIPLDTPYYNLGDTITADGKTMVIDYRPIMSHPLHPNCRCGELPDIDRSGGEE